MLLICFGVSDLLRRRTPRSFLVSVSTSHHSICIVDHCDTIACSTKMNSWIYLAFLSLFAITVPAATPEKRDVSPLKRDINTITSIVNAANSKTLVMDGVIKSFSGDEKSLTAAADDLLASIQGGTTQIQSAAKITLPDSILLQTAVEELTLTVNITMTDLISKKKVFVDAGLGPVVYAMLQQQLEASQAMSDAITSKVPVELHDVAESMSQAAVAPMISGLHLFEDVSGTSGSSNSQSVSTSASASTSKSSATADAASTGSAPRVGLSLGVTMIAAAMAIVT